MKRAYSNGLIRTIGPFALCLMLCGAASADKDQVTCQVRSMLGQTKAGGIDGKLSSLKKQLSAAPFSTYKTIKLIDNKQLKIGQHESKKATLPTKKIAKLTFKEKILEKSKVKLRMKLSISPANKDTFLPGTTFTIVDGGTLLVAGDPYKDGILIVGVTCKTRD